MKNSLLIGLVCLGIGFGAAWIIKDKTSEPPEANQPSARQAPSSPARLADSQDAPPTKSDNKPEDPKTLGAVAEAADDQPDREEMRQAFRGGQERWREMMTKRQQAREEAQIQKLIDRLGLSDAQADQLRAYFTKNRGELAAMMESGEEDWSKAKDFAKKLRGDGLEDELANILTDEQKVAYDEMKQRDRANQVEARAYKDLAKVQGVLDLTPEQKDQVYDILYQQAEQKINANQDANTVVSMFTQGLGLNIDPEDLGISGAIQVQIDQASSGEQVQPDPGAWMQAMQESRQKKIEEQMEALAPVLDDNQEAAYRAHLETQGGGLLGGFLGAGGAGADVDIEVDSIEIPAPDPE